MSPAPATASDLYPALLVFLQENGLNRTAKAFRKETGLLEETELGAAPELLQVVQDWYANGLDATKKKKKKRPAAEEEEAKAEEAAAAEEEEAAPKKKKKKEQKVEEEEQAEEEEAAPPVKKKEKKKKPAAAEEEEEEAVEKVEEAKKLEKKAAANEDDGEDDGKKQPKAGKKPKGVPFQREDWDKWATNIKDDRLKDNTHEAKGGDSWANQASSDLLKVRGRGFRKEMAKKKKASWRGGGTLDQGVHSIKFADSDSD